MTSAEFFNFLKKNRDLNTFPNSNAWPDQIGFSADMWKGIVKLHKWTDKHDREYETSCFFADGDVVFTPPFQGEHSSVTSSHNMNVKYVPKDKEGLVYEKQIFLDDKIAKRVSVKRENLPKQIQAGFLFNIHSHPIHYLDNRTGLPYDPANDPEYQSQQGNGSFWKNFVKVLTGRYRDPKRDNINLSRTYGFYSDTDIRSLLASSAVLSGLVTDEFWLVGKTDKAISQIGENGIRMLIAISQKAYTGDKFLEDTIRTQMNNWGLVFYRGKFNGTVKRVL